ncbi:hypothetical protein IMG5_103470 [Ichthyophthirius multifiliis]|uniref:Uncharacterized protein n=1 Tax=Ichthyophthirius multifiliis TaxID=5932 RepID=G0QST6_ICHMU|nr:hypothetical protein IMG5_103470 [Ichthyophthirius multifiliis]EGR31703.1 hypothetical protein IMG5_103470 [Ichthyophthirius multifiliis]|eukprot:XP_004035189.1 hypothetical protein IMG5_103470 [Ichthyophthirius multifiliis]
MQQGILLERIQWQNIWVNIKKIIPLKRLFLQETLSIYKRQIIQLSPFVIIIWLQVDKKQLKLEKNYFQIAHFISAILININLEDALEAKTSKEFDKLFQIKLHGMKTVNEYYEFLGCVDDLKNVKIPILCINSRDDPILHYSTIPYYITKVNQNVIFLITKTRHVGWFEGLLNPRRWYIKPTLQFLNFATEINNNN